MTNRLELNWQLDGFVGEQHYYCSETPINPLNLPTPKAVLAGDVRTYIDSNIEVGKNYYVRVGSVKNGTEKISPEVSKFVSAYRARILADNPIAYYPLNEQSGSVASDFASSPINGTIHNCSLNQPALAPSLGPSYYFNGAGRIELGSPAKFLTSGPTSMECWIKSSYMGGNPFQIGYNNGLRMQLDAALVANIIFGAALKLSSKPLIANDLLHIVFVCASTGLKIYVNGVLSKSMAEGGWAGIKSSANSAIGYAGASYAEYYIGYMSNVALYNYELSAATILDHYNLGIAS